MSRRRIAAGKASRKLVLALNLQVPLPVSRYRRRAIRLRITVDSSVIRDQKESSMEKRFRALRTIGTLLKVVAWIVLVVTVLGAIFVAIAGFSGPMSMLGDAVGREAAGYMVSGAFAAIIMGGAFLLGGVIYFVILYAAAEGIYVILSIEENTRLTAMAVSGRASM